MNLLLFYKEKIIGNNNRIKLIYKLLYAIGLLFIIIYLFKNQDQFLNSISQINLYFLIFPIILYPVGLIPTAIAWHFLLKMINEERTAIYDIYLYSLSIFSKHIPGYIWFLGSRSLVYKKENISNKNTIFLTILESILLSISGFILSLPFILVNRNLFSKNSLLFLISFCLIMILLFFGLTITPAKSFIKKISLKLFSEDYSIPNLLNKYVFYSVLSMFFGWIGGGLLLLFIIRCFIPVQFTSFLLACGIWGFSGAVSLSLGVLIQGLGIREITMALLLTVVLTPIQAASASILFRVILLIGEIFWVIIITYGYNFFYKKRFKGN